MIKTAERNVSGYFGIAEAPVGEQFEEGGTTGSGSTEDL